VLLQDERGTTRNVGSEYRSMSAARSLCLNMIVKNEMANLPRCLGAVADHINCWVIGDTGSTDGTQDFIKSFFADRGIPGELHSFPFRNFEQARNTALDCAYGSELEYDYLLLDDADMELIVEDKDFRMQLEHSGYRLLQRSDSGLSYWNTRLVQRKAGARYHGVTHEYLDLPGDVKELSGLWYKDHACGSNRIDKFERDIKLLLEALEREPENHRYWFYLAQSYRDAGRINEAAQAYAKRASMAGWDEEAWYARLQEARCLRKLGDEPGFLQQALAAFNQRPQRAEPLYDLAKFYREKGMNDVSVLFSEEGLSIERPSQDILFLEDFIYSAGLQEEYSIAANYSCDPARKDRGFTACNWLALNRQIPTGTRNLARSNLYFYVQQASILLPSFSARSVGFTPPDDYRPSNPSVTRLGDDIVVVQRGVNYTLTPSGEYHAPKDLPIHTRNFLLRLTPELEIQAATEILLPSDLPEPSYLPVQGFEDLRPFAWRNALWGCATVRQLNPEGWCEQVLARIDGNTGACQVSEWHILTPPGRKRHEKNWMPRVKRPTDESTEEQLQFIYFCDPTRVIDDQARTIAQSIPVVSADQFRGGSQAIAFNDGWLALIHEVQPRSSTVDRFYQHRFVWFDSADHLRRVSRPFFFHQKGVEFAAGLAWHPDGQRLLVSYSIGDREGWIATVEASDVAGALEDTKDVNRTMPRSPRGRHLFAQASEKETWGKDAVVSLSNDSLENADNRISLETADDPIVFSLFEEIGISHRILVEISSADIRNSTICKLSETDGWLAIKINAARSTPSDRTHVVTPDNAAELLARHGVPELFDLLFLDIGLYDFHVLAALLTTYRPNVIISKYNASLGPLSDCVIPYIRHRTWDGTNFFGASYRAFDRLANSYGYKVVCCDSLGVKIFLVRNDLLLKAKYAIADSVFRPPGYNDGLGHPQDPKVRRYLRSEHYLIPGIATAETPFGYISYFKNDAYIGSAFSCGRYWELHTITEVTKRLAGLRGLVLDIGAHIGSHSVGLAAKNPQLKFVCFEPQQLLFLLLERNIFENDLSDRFELLNAAAGSVAGALRLAATVYVEETGERRQIGYGDAQSVNLGGVQLGVDGESCQILRVDDRIWPSVVYVKVDAEGAEPLVFYGMQKLLRTNLPHVLFEDRDDRRLDGATLDALGIAEHVRNFSPRAYLESLGYQVERHGHDCIGRPGKAAPEHAQPNPNELVIPSTIFQTWKSKFDFPQNYAIWRRTFSLHNPHFEHILWDDNDNLRFVAENFSWFLETYRSYPREIYRADAIRYFFLYAIGGIYADMDVECLRPLDGLLGRGDLLLGRMGRDPDHPHSIPNAVMASKPRQEFWLLVMWLLMDFAKRGGEPEYLTGPIVLKAAVDLYLARDPRWVKSAINDIAKSLPDRLQPTPERSRVVLLPSNEWFAVDWTDPIHQTLRRDVLSGNLLADEEKRKLFPNSWMVTYWTHNW
jgi:FkbM family methyltransferase